MEGSSIPKAEGGTNKPQNAAETKAGLLKQFHEKYNELKDIMDKHLDKPKLDRIEAAIKEAGNRSQEDIKKLIGMLDGVMKVEHANPGLVDDAVAAMYESVINGGTPRQGVEQMQERLKNAPGMEKMKGIIDRITLTVENLQEQMSFLGSGTLKMLEKFFGPSSFLGKIFGVLKSHPKAQAEYLKKALGDRKLLPENLDVVKTVKPEMARALQHEKAAKMSPSYDFVDHIDSILVLAADANPLTKDNFEKFGEKAVDQYIANNPLPTTAPAAAPAGAPVATTPEVKAEPVINSKILLTKADGENLQINKNPDGKFAFKANKKTMVSPDVQVVTTIPAKDKETAFVFVTQSDGVEIKIAATEFSALALKADGKNLVTGYTKTNVEAKIEFTSTKDA